MFNIKWSMKWILSLGLLLLFSAFIIYEGTKAKVTMVIDEKTIEVRTHANDVKELLLEHDIKLEEHDIVVPEKDTKVFDGMNIAWKSSKQVTLIQNNQPKEVRTTENTVHELLNQEKITLGKNVEVTPNLSTEIHNNMTIKVKKAVPIELNVGGKKEQVYTTARTVSDLLEQEGISLSELDRVKPGLQTTLEQDTKVRVIRVEKVMDIVEEKVDAPVITKGDSSMVTGNRKVIHNGEAGLVKRHYQVTLENGKEVDRKLIKEEKIKETKPRIVAVGTKQLTPKAVVARGNGEVVKEFYVKATAYTAYCNGCSGTTRTGINLRENPELKVIAVDPNVIPLGTKVWVEGYGYALAADTGGAIKGNRIDLFIPDQKVVDSYGVQTVRIKIFK